MDDYVRISKLLSHLNLSANALSKEIGLKSPQIFYDIKAGKCGISKDLASAIQGRYLNISIPWLLTGDGEMLKNTQTIGDINNSQVCGVNLRGDGIHVNSDNYATLLKIVETNQKSTEKFQEQIDRLLTIVEMKYGAENR